MKAILVGLGLGLALSAAPLRTWAQADDAPPAWAYPVNPPDFKVQPDDGAPRHVPDSTAAFTLTQAGDLFFALDWHPSDHSPLPDIVAHGRKPDVMACGVCHRADGPGGPENTGIAGLSAQYIVQQMADFKSGARTTSVPQRIPPQLMIKTARGITDTEIEQAAAYFSGLKPRAVIKVVETATVPKTRVAGWFLAALPGGEMEPIAGRIIEVPEDLERFEMRDARSHFIAYVPPGASNRADNLLPPAATERARHARSAMGPN
jgi:cytochrome c553